jgi:protein-tyrosine phosphatase
MDYFDLLLAMDQSNLENMYQVDRKDKFTSKMGLMRAFDPEAQNADVPDPYYGGKQGFYNVFEMIERSSKELLDRLIPHIED